MIKSSRRDRMKDKLSEESPGPGRHEDKQNKKTDKRESKVDLINAKANKAMAVAQKRKWLVILIGIAIAAYYAIKSGAGSGLFDLLKSKLGGG